MSNEKDIIDTINVKKDLSIGKDALTINKKTYSKSNIEHVCEVDSNTNENSFPTWSLMIAVIALFIMFMIYSAGFFNTSGSVGIAFTLAIFLCISVVLQIINWAMMNSKKHYNMEIKLKTGETCRFEGDEELIKEKQKAAKKLLGY